MPNRIVAIHTRNGSPADLLSDTWFETVNPTLKAGWKIDQLWDRLASRMDSSFSPTLLNPDVVLISGIGHGNDDAFPAFDPTEILYSTQPGGVPPAEVTGRVVHFLSCSTAHGLHTSFLKAGCAAYIGYTALVTFGGDDVNKRIAIADAQIDICLAAGQSVVDAVNAAKKCYETLGLAYIGDLLVANPDRCTFKLGSPIVPLPPGVLPQNVISERTTAPSNVIAARAL